MTARSRKWLLLLVLLLLLPLLLIWQMPAGWVLGKIPLQPSAGSFQNVSGSIWKGRIDRLVWRGIDLGEVNWDFAGLDEWSPPRSRWQFHGSHHDYQLQGQISLYNGSEPSLTGVSGSLPAAWVDLSSSLPFVFLDGRFEVDLARLAIRDELPVDADGAVLWADAGLTGLINEPLGDVALSVETVDGVISFRIQSLGQADIRIEGIGRLSGNDYDLDLLARVAPHRDDVLSLLSKTGTPQADGSILMGFSGKLLPEEK